MGGHAAIVQVEIFDQFLFFVCNYSALLTCFSIDWWESKVFFSVFEQDETWKLALNVTHVKLEASRDRVKPSCSTVDLDKLHFLCCEPIGELDPQRVSEVAVVCPWRGEDEKCTLDFAKVLCLLCFDFSDSTSVFNFSLRHL